MKDYSFRFFLPIQLLSVLCALVLLNTGCSSSVPSASGDPAAESSAAESAAGSAKDTAQTPSEGGTSEKNAAEGAAGSAREPYPFVDAGKAPDSATVMVYLTGSDLEAGSEAATQDLREMMESGIDLGTTTLLVYTGGAPVWHSEDPVIPTDANVVYLLTEDGFMEVKRFEPLSMGEPENLSRFLNFCHDEYPSACYDLILWDHGNGPVMGYGSDKQYSGDSLTLPEMRTALEASPFGGEERLALVGFDACLMSSAELLCVWEDYADLLVASQELEPSMGWRYSFLKDVCRVSPRALGKEIVDVYMEGCGEFFAEHPLFQSDLTLAVLDLRRARDLEASLNTLFGAAAEDVSGDFNKLAVARVRSHGFARAGTGSEYDLVDLESLLTGMEEKYPDQTAAARQILSETVVYRDSNIAESCGLSLFYPYYNKKYYQNQWKDQYRALGCLPDYAAFLQRYDQVWLGTDLKELFEGELRPKESGAETYTMELSEQQLAQYAKGGYYILRRTGEGSYAIVYVSNDVEEKNGVLSTVFDGRILYVSDDYGDKNIPIVRAWETVGDETDYTILGASVQRVSEEQESSMLAGLIPDETQPVDIQLAVNAGDGSVTVKGIFERDDSQEIVAGKRRPILPEEWKLFSFYNLRSRYLIRGEDGHILSFWDWPEGDWITWTEYPVVNGLHFTYEPLYDDGYEYFLMFEITDVQGNRYASELLPITLADAPEEETREVPAREIPWESGTSVTLCDEQNVRVSLSLTRKHDSGMPVLVAEVINDNDFPVHVNLCDAVLDGRLAGSNGAWILADPHSTVRRTLNDMTEALAREGRTCPERLDCVMKVENQRTGGYMVYKQPLSILFSEGLQPEALAVPCCSALAGEQELTPSPLPGEEGENTDSPAGMQHAGTQPEESQPSETRPSETQPVRVDLLGLGQGDPTASSGSLVLDLRLRNTSEEDVDVKIAGLVLNGLFYSLDQGSTLAPGETRLSSVSIGEYSFLKTDSGYTSDYLARRITSVSSVSLLLAQNGAYRLYPVTLSEQGSQPGLSPEGTVLFEDGSLRLRVEAPSPWETTDGSDAQTWPVWIENTSSRPLNVYLYHKGEDADEGGWLNYTCYANTGPGTVSLRILQADSADGWTEEDLSFYAEIRDERGQTLLITEPFVLPRP